MFEDRVKGTALTRITLKALRKLIKDRGASIEAWAKRYFEAPVSGFLKAFREAAKEENAYRTLSNDKIIERVAGKARADDLLNLISFEINLELGRVSFDPLELENIFREAGE